MSKTVFMQVVHPFNYLFEDEMNSCFVYLLSVYERLQIRICAKLQCGGISFLFFKFLVFIYEGKEAKTSNYVAMRQFALNCKLFLYF